MRKAEALKKYPMLEVISAREMVSLLPDAYIGDPQFYEAIMAILKEAKDVPPRRLVRGYTVKANT